MIAHQTTYSRCANGLSSVLIGQHGGKPETYAGCFRRLYGEAL